MNLNIPAEILLSIVNTKLRNNYHSLTVLCEEEGIDKTKLETKLATIDLFYNESVNQFKPKQP